MSYLYVSHDGIGTLELVCTGYETSISANTKNGQTKQEQHVLTSRLTQQRVTFNIQTRSLDERDKINKFISDHHAASLAPNNTHPTVANFVWPEQDLNYSGVIIAAQERHVVGEYAPALALNVLLVNNLLATRTFHSSITEAYSKFEANAQDLSGFREPVDPKTIGPKEYGPVVPESAVPKAEETDDAILGGKEATKRHLPTFGELIQSIGIAVR